MILSNVNIHSVLQIQFYNSLVVLEKTSKTGSRSICCCCYWSIETFVF